MTIWRMTALTTAAALAVAACGGASRPDAAARDEADNGGLSGSINIDGSSTVGPLTDAIAEEYATVQPDVHVNVAISGTGGGFERFCGSRETDISNASRPIKDEEAQLCRDNGVEYTEVRVGTDALTMVVNPAVDFVDCLTTEEVARIFGPDDPAATWSEVRAGLPDEELVVFAPGADSGTYDFMVEDVLDVEGARQDYQASEDDNIIAQGVQGTTGAWGFFGFAYYQHSSDTLKALAYDAGEGCVEPSIETAQDDSYRMARPLFIYVDTASLRRDEHVADFVNFYLDTVADVIGDVGYIPAAEEVIEQAKAKVDEAVGS